MHYAHSEYIDQLEEMIWDEPRISLKALPPNGTATRWSQVPPEPSLDAWKNAGGYWQTHLLKLDYAAFALTFFRRLAGQMKRESPLDKPEDLLFDYLKLRPAGELEFEPRWVLFINSAPMSGQAQHYDPLEMEALIGRMHEKHGGPIGNVVCTARGPAMSHLARCTADTNMSVTAIGRLSHSAHTIVMVATGPCWPTFNVWNRDRVKSRIIISERESLAGLDPDAVHVQDVHAAALQLHKWNLL